MIFTSVQYFGTLGSDVSYFSINTIFTLNKIKKASKSSKSASSVALGLMTGGCEEIR